MSTTASEAEVIAKLETLLATLRAASLLVAEVAHDPLLDRLIGVFHLMPAEDRGIVIGVLEREVQTRLLTRATEAVTGQGARANPNARLYVRSHGREAQRADLERDEMRLATVQVLKVVPLLAVPELHATWRHATRDALEHADPETIAITERLVLELLEMVQEQRRAEPAA